MKISVLKKGDFTVKIKGPRKILSFDELFLVCTGNWVSGSSFLEQSRKRNGKQFAARNLRYYRKKAKMTQKQLAKAVGSEFRHHISEMETGKRPIGKAMALKLAKALGILRMWTSLLTEV